MFSAHAVKKDSESLFEIDRGVQQLLISKDNAIFNKRLTPVPEPSSLQIPKQTNV